MKKKITHKDRVLSHLKRNRKRGLTSLTAFKEYGITRLSAVIFNLRNEGYKISSNKIALKNRYKEKVLFSKYVLEELEK